MAEEAQKKETKAKALKPRRPKAKKRDLQSKRAQVRNRSFKASVRTAIRSFEDTLAKGDAAETKESLSSIYSVMDRAVQRGVFTQNKAGRTKARLTARASSK
jgi:small subunit ribosomal protein S20